MNKKLLLIWTFLLCFVMGMSAKEVTIDFSTKNLQNGKDISQAIQQDGASVSFEKGSNSNGPKYYTSGTAIRLYAGNLMTVSSTNNITAITLTFGSGDSTTKKISANCGEYVEPNWTGNASSIAFTVDGTSGNRRIKALTITVDDNAAVKNPVIEGVTPFVGSTSVSMSCETSGAKIYYTTNGDDPSDASTEYTAPFELSATTTVKAIAISGKDKSSIVTKEFVATPTVANIGELNALTDKSLFCFSGEVTVIEKADNRYLYVKDATGTSLIFNAPETETIEVGQHIAPNWTGSVSIYNGLFEAVPSSALTVVDGVKDEIAKAEITADNVKAENCNTLGVLKGVTYSAAISDTEKNFTITAGDATITGYNQFKITADAPAEGDTYDIYGAIGIYKENVQFWPITITRNPKVVAVEVNAETGSDLAALVEAKTNEITAAGDKVGNIKVTLAAAGKYTMSKAITAPASVEIEGDAAAYATIDAAGLTEPFVKLNGCTTAANNQDGTPNAAYKYVENVKIANVKINGLAASLVNDAEKALVNNVTLENAVVEMQGSSNVFDFKGYPANLTINKSTLWSKEDTKHTGQLIKTAGRVKDLDGSQAEYKQAATITNSTLYKIACGKQLNNFQGKGQKSIFLTMKSTIISCSTQDGNEVRGWLGGQNSTNPTVVYDNNTYIGAEGAQEGWTDDSKQGADLTGTSKDFDPEFANAAEGDFSVFAGSMQAKYKIGDPMWLVEYDQAQARPINIELELDSDCDLAEELNEEMANFDKVGDVTIYLGKDGKFTAKTPIIVPGRLRIVGEKDNPATIDASENTGAFVQLSATPNESIKGTGDFYIINGATGIDLRNLNINGVKGQLIYDNNVKYCVENLTIDSCTVKLASDESTNVNGNAIIYFKGGFANTLSVTNSTFWNSGASDAKYFVQYNNSGRCSRAGFENNFVIFQNNTFYNVAKKGQWANYGGFAGQQTSGFIVTDNIFANCGNNQIARRILGGRGASSYAEGMVTFNNNTYMTKETVEGVETTKFESTDGIVEQYDLSGTAIEMDPMFADAANGDFTLGASTKQAKVKTGAPRWLVDFVAEDITEAKAALKAEIEKATELLGNADTENDEAAKALKAAIDKAQGVYDTAEFNAEINKAIEELKAAEDAYKTTAISNVNVAETENGAWYTLQGVRVANPQKGVFIHNGKKVVLK